MSSSKDIHLEARRLILDRSGSALDAEKTRRLEAHLEECASCAAYADTTGHAIATLRSVSETPPPALVRATQRTVRLSARNLGEAESQRRMILVSCVLAAGWGVALQPYLWRLLGWLGASLGLPDPVWQGAFVAMWLVPTLVAVLLLTHPPASWLRTGIKGRRNR
jgi:anti-sigma factor RsiW